MSSVGHNFSQIQANAVARPAAPKFGPRLVTQAETGAESLASRRIAGERARSRARETAMLGSALLRFLDLLSLSIVLVLLVVHTFLRDGTNAAGFFTMRISVRNLVLEAALLFCWRTLFWTIGLYQARRTPTLGIAFWRVMISGLFCTALVWPVITMRHAAHDTLHSVVGFWLLSTTFMLMTRLALFAYGEWIKPLLRRKRNVIVCGTGLRSRLLALELPHNEDYKYMLVGFIDSNPQPECTRLAPVLGGVDDLEGILMQQPIDEVVIGLPVKSQFDQIQKIVRVCGNAGVQTQYSLDIFTTEVAKHRDVEDGSRVRLQMVAADSRIHLKNVFDLVAALLGVAALSPLMLLIAILIKLDSKGPVFFTQERFGFNKRRFGMIKFRSMVVDASERQAALEHLNEAHGPLFKMKSDPRVTRLGAFMRRTSLDELPQLFNVLQGDMSLVGPRPLPTRDVQRFSEAWLMRRFSVKPGITGLWQVSGRSDTDFAQAIKLDLRYIDRWSLRMDAKILLRTFCAVLRTRGAY